MIKKSPKFEKIKLEIIKILASAEFELESAHALDTLNWVKKIDKNASESLQIAALAHDIDRGIGQKIIREDGETYDEYKVRHAKRGAKLISELMAKFGYSKELIVETADLVLRHEVGGTKDADILKDADSVSFFSCNIEWYYNYKNKNDDEMKREILYKYERATPRAKELIKSIKIKNKVIQNMCQEIFFG